MPESIEGYFQSVLDLLDSLPFVATSQTSLEKRADTVGFVRGDIELRDGSLFHFRELIDLRAPMRSSMYAYHYQTAEGRLLFRYDNTPHHPGLSTFPHHKHTGEVAVVAADAPSLEAALREIESLMAEADEPET